MRTGPSGVRSKSAHATIAVTSTATISPTVITERFEAREFVVTEDSNSSRTRRDRAVVFTAIRLDANVGSTVSLIATYAVQQVLLPQGRFQPVWDVGLWCTSGLELLVLNDTDACAQLDALSEVLDRRRELITIKPRTGWQGYGPPEVEALG
jgi:hypothetical protein